MPLELPNRWCSLAAPKTESSRKWDAIKRAPLNQNLRAFNLAEAHTLAKQLMTYKAEPGRDYWQSPAETVRLKTGDCEDFAILARALLINGGVDEESLWLLIVHDLATSQDHALLWHAGEEGHSYLDVRAPHPLTAEKFVDYRPIVGFNNAESVTFGRRVA